MSILSIPVLIDTRPSRSFRLILNSGAGVRTRNKYSNRRGFDPSTCNRPGIPT